MKSPHWKTLLNIDYSSFMTRLGMIALLLVLASGCASSGPPTFSKAALLDFGLPSPGKAKIVFVRPGSGDGVDIGVHDGEQLVAKLGGKSYGVHECDPGQHVFSGSFGNMEILDATLLPDRIYYVKAELVMQMWGPAWVKLTPLHPGSPDETWQKLPRVLSKVNRSTVTPEQAERDRTGIARYLERLKAYRDKPGAVFGIVKPEYGQSAPPFSQ